jgi:hypothetical protein
MVKGNSKEESVRINARIPLRLYRKLAWAVEQNESTVSIELKKLIKRLPDPPKDWEPGLDD